MLKQKLSLKRKIAKPFSKKNTAPTVYQEIQRLDQKILCLNTCFCVISDENMLDSVNLELLALKRRRACLFAMLKREEIN